MKWLHKASKLSASDILLLSSACQLLWCVRLGLWLLPFPVLRGIVSKRLGPATPNRLGAHEGGGNPKLKNLWRCVWAIGVTKRLVPQATCLTQALTAQILLNRRGYEAIVHIGVAKSETGKYQAHAWVESEGRVVIGGTRVESWTPLATLRVD